MFHSKTTLIYIYLQKFNFWVTKACIYCHLLYGQLKWGPLQFLVKAVLSLTITNIVSKLVVMNVILIPFNLVTIKYCHSL